MKEIHQLRNLGSPSTFRLSPSTFYLPPSIGRSCQLVDRVYNSPMKVTAVVHKADEGGFWAEVPSLPGCRTQGDTMDELKTNLREAVELYLETDPSGLTADKNSQLLELAV